MYNQYALHRSTAEYPEFSHSRLSSPYVNPDVSKPSFLIQDEHGLSHHLTSHRPEPELLGFNLSDELLRRLDRVNRNPFFKHSEVYLKPLDLSHSEQGAMPFRSRIDSSGIGEQSFFTKELASTICEGHNRQEPPPSRHDSNREILS
jgi:hypothetical protein